MTRAADNATTAPSFRFVPEHVARNPVARAIAKRNLEAAVRDFSTRLYMLQDGENVASDVHAAAKTLAVAMAVLEIQRQADTPAGRIIAGGMGALADVANTGHLWRTRHAVAVDQALKHARQVYAAAPAKVVQEAHGVVAGIEARHATAAAPGGSR